jgi:hypothetical protein
LAFTRFWLNGVILSNFGKACLPSLLGGYRWIYGAELNSMKISQRLLNYFDRKKSKSTKKSRTRFRNDICNHWDLDYLSTAELEERLLDETVETTIPLKKLDP